jgi:ubiquinone/menaquinone biosynthesis C-methylase UbiE
MSLTHEVTSDSIARPLPEASSSTMAAAAQARRPSPRMAWVEKCVRERYSKSRILDVGFIGRYEQPFLHLALRRDNQQAQVVGVDINVEKVVKCGLPKTIVADAGCIAARDASFDVVLCLEMLEHLTSPMPALVEFRRVLRRGGELVITTPNAWSWANFFRHWMVGSLNSRSERSVYRHYLGDADHKQFYDPLSLMSLLDLAGFKTVDVATKNHAIPFLRRWSRSLVSLDCRFYPLNRLGHYICLIAETR